MKKVLLIDNEKELRDLLADFIKDEGIRVETAANGHQGLVAIHNDRDIGCVIVDVHMPELGGVEFFRICRNQFPYLPVALLTGDPGEVFDLMDSEDLPVILKKPVEFEVFIDTIRQQLESTGPL